MEESIRDRSYSGHVLLVAGYLYLVGMIPSFLIEYIVSFIYSVLHTTY